MNQRQDALVILWETRFIAFKQEDHYRVLDRCTGMVAASFRHGVQTPREWPDYAGASNFAAYITEGKIIHMQSYIKEGRVVTLDEPVCWAPCWRLR